MKTLIALLSLLMVTTLAARAGDVRVTVMGTVVSNDVDSSPLGSVVAGERVVLSFELDTATVQCEWDEWSGSCRYRIDTATAELSFEGGETMGLRAPAEFATSLFGGPGGGRWFWFDGWLSQDPVQVELSLRYERWVADDGNLPGLYDHTWLLESRFDLWEDAPDNVVAEFEFERMLIEALPATPIRASSWGQVKDAFADPGD